jgi:DNA-binding transcriptional LysR family regulator
MIPKLPAISGVMVNLRELELFGTLMRVGTTTETARVLGISQPGVSGQIRRLEARLGFALFRRSGNRLEPTAEARALFAEAAPAFAAQAALRQRIEALRRDDAGAVAVSATPAIVEGFLAPRLASAGFAGWRRRLRLMVTDPEGDLRGGRAEFGLQLAVPPRAEFTTATLAVVPLVAVMKAEDALAGRPTLDLATIARRPLVGYDPDWSPMGAAIRDAFRRAGLAPDLAAEAPFCATVCQLVAACGGIGIIDAMTAGRLDPRLVARPIVAAPAVPLVAFHRRDPPLRAAALALWEALARGAVRPDRGGHADQ